MAYFTGPLGIYRAKLFFKVRHIAAITAAALGQDSYRPHHCCSTLGPPALTVVSAYLCPIQVGEGSSGCGTEYLLFKCQVWTSHGHH